MLEVRGFVSDSEELERAARGEQFVRALSHHAVFGQEDMLLLLFRLLAVDAVSNLKLVMPAITGASAHIQKRETRTISGDFKRFNITFPSSNEKREGKCLLFWSRACLVPGLNSPDKLIKARIQSRLFYARKTTTSSKMLTRC